MPPGSITLKWRTVKPCLWHLMCRKEDEKGKMKPKIKQITQASNKKFLICIRRESTERKLAGLPKNQWEKGSN